MEINLFTNYDGIDKHAYMNWRFWNKSEKYILEVMSDSYLDATTTLLKECLMDNQDKKADSLVFPILFSFNHYIELKLKSIFAYYNYLENNNKHLITMREKNIIKLNTPYPHTHNINTLFKNIENTILASNLPKIEKDKERFSTLSSYLKQLNKYQIFRDSPNMDFTRYPNSKNKGAYFYVKTYKNVTISLVGLSKIKDEVRIELEGLSDQLEYYNELKKEMEESRDYY